MTPNEYDVAKRWIEQTFGKNYSSPLLSEFVDDEQRHPKLHDAFNPPSIPWAKRMKDFLQKHYSSLMEDSMNTDELEFVKAVQLTLVSREDATPELLDHFSKSPSASVRKIVAKHQNALPETLDRLADDSYFIVRFYVAQNEHTSADTLDRLSSDDDMDVLSAIAKNPNTSVETLNGIFQEHDMFNVNISLAKNPNCPPEILDELSSKDNGVKEFIAMNPNATAETLDRLADVKSDSNVQKQVLLNPHTSTETLLRLSFCDNEELRDMATEKLKQRMENENC